MRSALGELKGVGQIDVQVGQKDFTVKYDQDQVTVDQMLAKLEAAGEPASRTR